MAIRVAYFLGGCAVDQGSTTMKTIITGWTGLLALAVSGVAAAAPAFPDQEKLCTLDTTREARRAASRVVSLSLIHI